MADRPLALARPHRFALVAAAEVITSSSVKTTVKNPGRMLDWQERAWDFYDRVGEFRFGVSWASNALSRVNLCAARPPKNVGDEPTPISPDDEELTPAEARAMELVAMIAGGASGQGQLLAEFGEHLAVAGFGWMVAEPSLDDAAAVEYETWCVYAQDGLRLIGSGESQTVEVRVGDGNQADAWRRLHPNSLVVKTWRKHPRRPWEADAPVRGVLGVLEIIELLTAHLTATGRSRLAGAGLLAIPSEAEFPDPPGEEGEDATAVSEQDRFDHFVEELTKAMTTPIRDRDNASAVVPLPIAIPGEFIDKLQHLSFSTPFDDKLESLLEQNIKRLALGMDMPPEVLTGMAGVNHGTAWQVEETAITLHVEPSAEIVCHALTIGFVRDALAAEGLDPDAAMVWYLTDDLTSPPDKSGNAKDAYDRLELSGSALRREGGFSDDDKPDEEEFRQRVLLDAAKGAPTLAPTMLAEAGLLDPQIADAAEAAAPAEAEAPAPETEAENVEEGTEAGPPPRDARPSAVEAALDSAILMACDGIVDRALERAGNRLRSSIGRRVEGGPQAVDGAVDSRTLHTVYDPTIYADLDALLDGSFARVPVVAEYLGVDADALYATLNAYLRGLLAAQHDHDLMRLSSALGADVMV
jgi:hypothetical protein